MKHFKSKLRAVDWKSTLMLSSSTLRDAVQNLTTSGLRIILIVNSVGKLMGTLSDGDIRRGLLRGFNLDSLVEEVMNRSPLIVPRGISSGMVRQIMAVNKVQHIPEIGEDGGVIYLHFLENFEAVPAIEASMVIMAGGKGSRLRPYTEACPKPMLSVQGKPILEHIIERGKAEGFRRFIISVNYLGHVIENHFGDGERFGVEISYIRETAPLGTAGGLSLFETVPDLPFVVTNGDILTDIRYADLLEFHHRQSADATMAVRLYEWQHPYGVVGMDGLAIIGFEEKPVTRTRINAGVYAVSPGALGLLLKGEACDMPQFFERLLANVRRTIAYPMHEPWLDIGRPGDLATANEC